jgi:murein L,D-transpeptidase YcbB/YkuD
VFAAIKMSKKGKDELEVSKRDQRSIAREKKNEIMMKNMEEEKAKRIKSKNVHSENKEEENKVNVLYKNPKSFHNFHRRNKQEINKDNNLREEMTRNVGKAPKLGLECLPEQEKELNCEMEEENKSEYIFIHFLGSCLFKKNISFTIQLVY